MVYYSEIRSSDVFDVLGRVGEPTLLNMLPRKLVKWTSDAVE